MTLLMFAALAILSTWVGYKAYCIEEEVFQLRQDFWEFKQDLNKDIEYLEQLIIKKNLE